MPTAYTGPGWETPERKKISSGSLADVYIHAGFTVASIVEPSWADRRQVERCEDIAIYSPIDAHKTAPLAWVRDFATAEQFIANYRTQHPDLPTAPVPDAVMVPIHRQPSDARRKIREIVAVLEERDLELHGYKKWHTAVLLYTYRQNWYIDQKSIDVAQMLDAVRIDMLSEEDR